jgi:eukaryotic-like serine/threonine-protein kinase
MATVYLGRLVGPVGFSRTVAIKRLHPQFARDPEFVAMFLDEARVAARIRHPNVVPTLDVVATEGELFLVMDYVQGEALSQLFRAVRSKGGAVPAPVAVNILLGVLHGLHAAHEATNERGEALGIVHRDVSPQNVLVGTDGVPRLVDFGVAKAVGRLQTTREGQLKGKAAYMAPEQVRGGEVTRQADVFAASVVLWEALTGRRLFQGNSDAETIYRLLDAEIEPPSQITPSIPAALDAVVLRGLARNAANRYESALAMALDLEKTVGMVSSREVGAWVHEMAGARLDERNQQVLAIEQSSSDINLETLKSGLMGGEPEITSGVESLEKRSEPPLARTASLPDITSSDVSLALPTTSRKPAFAAGVFAALLAVSVVGFAAYSASSGPPAEGSAPAPSSTGPATAARSAGLTNDPASAPSAGAVPSASAADSAQAGDGAAAVPSATTTVPPQPPPPTKTARTAAPPVVPAAPPATKKTATPKHTLHSID